MEKLRYLELFCNTKQSKILSAGRNTTVDDSIPTCQHTSEKTTGFQEGKRSVVTLFHDKRESTETPGTSKRRSTV